MTAPEPLRPSASTPRKKFVLPLVALAGLGTVAAANYFISSALHPNAEDEKASPPAATAPGAAKSASAASTAMRTTPLPDQDYLQNPRGAAQRIERLIRETGGDWNKLPPDDQRLFDSVSSGRGREMLRGRAEQLKEEAARGKVTPPSLRK